MIDLHESKTIKNGNISHLQICMEASNVLMLFRINLEIAFCNLVNFFQGYGFPGLPGPIGQKGEKGECKGNVSV